MMKTLLIGFNHGSGQLLGIKKASTARALN